MTPTTGRLVFGRLAALLALSNCGYPPLGDIVVSDADDVPATHGSVTRLIRT
jgi:hypothetical protein